MAKRSRHRGVKLSVRIQLRKAEAALPVKTRLRKDDTVTVIAGRDRGKTGRILSIDRVKGRALIEGVMIVKRHTKPNPSKQVKGGIAEREASIALSNVMLLASDGKPTRIGYRVEGAAGRRVRIARRTGEPVEKKTK